MSVFDTNLPSVRQLQVFVKDKVTVEVGLLTNQTLQGKLLWQDHNCICLLNQEQDRVIIWFHAVAYVKPQSSEKQSTVKVS
jgi:host factor-I protein